MEKFTGEVKFINEYSFYSNYGYYGNTVYIYKFLDKSSKVYVWKTTNLLFIDVEQEDGSLKPVYPTKGSTIKITASIKGENDYNGEHQILLTRVKIQEIVHREPTWEEKQEEIAKDQIASLKDGDFIWEMPYKQYKMHYSDCETVKGSFTRSDSRYGGSTISVIIRKGRLKNSGVRGEHYSGYRFVNEIGQHATYRAVSVDNAERRINKDYPNHEWTLDKVYEYRTDRIW